MARKESETIENELPRSKPRGIKTKFLKRNRCKQRGIKPAEIKNYLRASCVKGEIEKDMDRISNGISDILRQEDGKCCHTELALKDILIVPEANRSSGGLRQIFLGKIN